MPPRLRRAHRPSLLLGLAGVVGALLIWEVLGRADVFGEYLPPASAALTVAGELTADEDFQDGVLHTVTEAATGLLIAVAIAVPLGLVLGGLPRVELAFRPIIEFLRPIPSVALIPLAVFVFTTSAEVALIVFSSSWPILINTLYGVRDTDPVAKDTLRSFGFGRQAVLWRVALPSAAPFIATGVRLSSAIAIIVATSYELIVGGDGMGALLIDTIQTSIDPMPEVAAIILWAGVLGIAINTLLARGESWLFRWRTETA